MDGFSTVDGFMDVNEGVADMIKYLANEPSVGLFFVQQHTQNAVPNLLHVKDKVVEKSHEITLHTEDLEDSISMVESMKECGFSIADEMNKDIKKSLLIMSTSQPKKGDLIGRLHLLEKRGSINLTNLADAMHELLIQSFRPIPLGEKVLVATISQNAVFNPYTVHCHPSPSPTTIPLFLLAPSCLLLFLHHHRLCQNHLKRLHLYEDMICSGFLLERRWMTGSWNWPKNDLQIARFWGPELLPENTACSRGEMLNLAVTQLGR